ncbi:MAG TPA: hypothetical protein VIX14_06045, partial [Terriglobales bacterium]
MPSTQNAVNNHEYRSIPITTLVESASNPRKRFDETSLEELAAYVPGHISGLGLNRYAVGIRPTPVCDPKIHLRPSQLFPQYAPFAEPWKPLLAANSVR